MNRMQQTAQERHKAHFNYRRLSPEEMETYADQGFILLDDVLTEQGVAEMKEQCMSFWSAQKEDYDPSGSWLKNMLLDNAHHHAPIVRDYYFEGPLVNIAEQLIGPNLKGVTAQLTFKLRGNTKRVHWHQDNVYGELAPYNAITCLTALDKSDEANGCLWIAPGSHKDGQRRAGFTEEERAALIEIELKPDDSAAMPMPMEPGQCLIFTCWTYHRSDGNSSKDRDRRILFIRYADADAVEVYNNNRPRLGRVVRGASRFPDVMEFETDL